MNFWWVWCCTFVATALTITITGPAVAFVSFPPSSAPSPSLFGIVHSNLITQQRRLLSTTNSRNNNNNNNRSRRRNPWKSFGGTHSSTALQYQSGGNMTTPSASTEDVEDSKASPASTTPAAVTSSTCSDNSSSNNDDDNNTTTKSLQALLPPLDNDNGDDIITRVYLLRHGETDWNALGKIQGGGHDIPLNDNGRLQATKAAIELDGIPLDIVASSSLSRAKETADILHARHTGGSGSNNGGSNGDNGGGNIERIVDEGFNEMSFGEWEGWTSKDKTNPTTKKETKRFKSTTKQVKEDPTFKFPGGGECTNDVEQRAVQALYKILRNSTTTSTTDSTANVDNDQDTSEQQQHIPRHVAIVSHGRTNKVIIASTGLGDVQRFPEVKQANVAINVMDYNHKTQEWTVHIINYFDHVDGHVIIR